MQPVEIRLINNVVVEESNLPDTEPGEKHGNCAACAAAANKSHPQLPQIAIKGGPESERLAIKGAPVSTVVAAGIMEGQSRPDDLDAREWLLPVWRRVQPDAACKLIVSGQDY